ncbi:MAG: ATP-dependent 6-phosphofructokinase [Anaerolineales bacterium]|nr:ATP-dependent 6-phosphofructokinase [Anaerolineales bacterium]MCB9126514.1 ATP-dependent 6-phosphofructokinase [Ardenticatenales bacterium]
MKTIKKIAINTGGGDAPGLNAVIRAATIAAEHRGWEVVGIREGYNGLLFPETCRHGEGLIDLNRKSVRGITHLGGTILGTTNKGNPLEYPVQNEDGSWRTIDLSGELLAKFDEHGIDALIAVGGDGSLGIANQLNQKGLPVIGVPKTIDNDLDGTVVTFGFDTAVSFGTECVDRLHSTAESHKRTIVVEVMGRYAGWIALHVGLAGSADVILIPEIPYDMNRVAEKIRQRYDTSTFAIVVVAEGATEIDGQRAVVAREIGRAEQLGGIGARVAAQIRALTGVETRSVSLGHLVRGGTPTPRDRLISLRFGAAAVRALAAGERGIMVALDPPNVAYVPLSEATSRMKAVPLDCDTMLTSRDLGISFGDEFELV